MQHKPSHRIVWSWAVAVLLPYTGITLLCRTILHPFLPERIRSILLILWISAVIVWLGVYLPLRWRRLTFSLSPDGLTMTGGVVFPIYRRMPLTAVRHVTLLQGPVERISGITYLLVSAAGGHILVEGLDTAQAQTWCRFLLPDG